MMIPPLPKPQPPLVVSYYTPNTRYEVHARKLARSLARFDVDHVIQPRRARESWVENCAQKSAFVQEMRRSSERSILWIDADAFLVRPLSGLADLDADFAAVKRDGWSFYGGQIYFGTGDPALELVERWAFYCQRHPHIWDQVTLGYAWWDMVLGGGLKSHWLPQSFSAKLKRNQLARIAQRVTTSATILHRQESRVSKRLQAPRVGEFGNDHLPRWWREAAALDRPFPLDAAQLMELGLTN